MQQHHRRINRDAIVLVSLTIIAIIGTVLGAAARVGATEARDCSKQQSGVFVERHYTGPDGKRVAELRELNVKVGDTFTVHTKLRPGCEATPNFIVFHATAFAPFNPDEPSQPRIGEGVELADNGDVTLTVPVSPFTGQCKVQIDHALHPGLDAITKSARYNEPSADPKPANPINRLIGATYADGECVTTPPPSTTTSTQPEPTTTTTEPAPTTTQPEPTTSTTAPAPTTTEPAPTTSQPIDPVEPTTSTTAAAPTTSTTVDDGAGSSTTVTTSKPTDPTQRYGTTPLPTQPGSLPFTGDHTGSIARFGAVLLAAGALAVLAARRRLRPVTES